MKKYAGKWISAILAVLMVLSLLPVTALASSQNFVTVRIIGENSVILNTTVHIDDVTDCTQDANDSSTEINALDAVLHATEQNGYDSGSYQIAYNTQYGSYYIGKIAGIAPSASDYWGSLAISASGNYDGGSLNAHAIAAGDTYVLYYDKYTGSSSNYGYQFFAWFANNSVSGAAGSAIPIEVQTIGYDQDYRTVAAPLSGATVYETGPDNQTPTPLAVTDAEGKANIILSKPGTYTLTLSSGYTFAQCQAVVTGEGAALSNLSLAVTDGANILSNARLTLTDDSGGRYSPYQVDSGTYSYRLPNGIYRYEANADGYHSSSGAFSLDGPASRQIVLGAQVGYKISITPGGAAEETVVVKDEDGAKQTAVSTSGGVYTYDLQNGAYTYIISRSGYHSFFGSFTVKGANLDIAADRLANPAASTAQWPSFRDPASNMAIISSETATGAWQAKEKWAVSLGSLGAYGSLSASNLVLYDEYLYAATEHGLSKIDKNTGRILTTTPLSTDISYVPQIAFGDGKIFVATVSGIDSFDALTMERVWSAPISVYGNYMASTPILYDAAAKTLYVGDYGDSNYTLGSYGGYSAISAVDGTNKWTLYGGAADARYWAGAVLAGDYVVFGSDSGTLSSIKTGSSGYASPSGTLSVTGKIRSSIAYDGAYLYFTTNSGCLYKVSIDQGAGLLTVACSCQFTSGSSSSTPVVQNGRIYVGASDGIYVFDADNLSLVSHEAASGPVQSSALLTTAYNGTAYAYFAVNSPRGELVVLADDGANVSYETLYTPSLPQYCLSSLIADTDGVLYYTNDSGSLFAVQNNREERTDKAKITFNVSPSSFYDPTASTTEYPVIAVQNSKGAAVSTGAAGVYYLPTGTYSYTVSLCGYTTYSGSFQVAEDNISGSGLTISVPLSPSSPAPSAIHATVSVIGDNNSVWIENASVTVPKSSSAWAAIKKALDNTGLDYVASETSLGIYISSVNGLAELDKGPNSGWKYFINGSAPGTSVSSYALSGDEQITLCYTSDYTNDDDSPSSPSSQYPAAHITAALNQSAGIADALLSGAILNQFNQSIAAQKDTGGAQAVLSVDLPDGAQGTSVTLPQSTINALANKKYLSLRIETGFADLTFDCKAIQQISTLSGGTSVTLLVSKASSANLDAQDRKIVGERPVYRFSMAAGDRVISTFGDGRAQVRIPYVLAPDENKNALVAFCLSPSGTLQTLRSSYDAKAGCADFTVSQFSTYAVGYRKPDFTDAAENAWYANALTFCAARDITTGTGNHMFSPEAPLTRGQSIVLLMRAYGIVPDDSSAGNFSDAGNTYYTNYLSAAKRLGITSGVGGNAFLPERIVTRQEFFTLLYHTLSAIGELPGGTSGTSLTSFSDACEISEFARDPMEALVSSGVVNGAGGKLLPQETASRAQAVQVLYNLLSL
ncbi:MAG: S-layer homology domain-containing protein [Oscillospiraceae bacterium]|nr:S-layer homology domain-containing protein [Oscillospiraceae bacterium]